VYSQSIRTIRVSYSHSHHHFQSESLFSLLLWSMLWSIVLLEPIVPLSGPFVSGWPTLYHLDQTILIKPGVSCNLGARACALIYRMPGASFYLLWALNLLT